MKNFKPLHDRVLVHLEMPKDGLIVRPDSAEETPSQGIVLAVGPGKQYEKGGVVKVAVKKGERVLFPPYGGIPLEDGFRIFKEEEILAVLI